MVFSFAWNNKHVSWHCDTGLLENKNLYFQWVALLKPSLTSVLPRLTFALTWGMSQFNHAVNLFTMIFESERVKYWKFRLIKRRAIFATGTRKNWVLVRCLAVAIEFASKVTKNIHCWKVRQKSLQKLLRQASTSIHCTGQQNVPSDFFRMYHSMKMLFRNMWTVWCLYLVSLSNGEVSGLSWEFYNPMANLPCGTFLKRFS